MSYLPSFFCKHYSTGNVYFMTTMTKSLDEKATFGLLFNLPFDSWYHFKDKHWRIVGNRRSESQMKNVNVIPYLFLFFQSQLLFCFLVPQFLPLYQCWRSWRKGNIPAAREAVGSTGGRLHEFTAQQSSVFLGSLLSSLCLSFFYKKKVDKNRLVAVSYDCCEV